MIRRKHYSEEFKRKIALEMIMSSTPAGEISKREWISSTTLYKWRDNYSSEKFSSGDQEVVFSLVNSLAEKNKVRGKL